MLAALGKPETETSNEIFVGARVAVNDQARGLVDDQEAVPIR
jgi:hypothetical protein